MALQCLSSNSDVNCFDAGHAAGVAVAVDVGHMKRVALSGEQIAVLIGKR